jgi:hypothetical protein
MFYRFTSGFLFFLFSIVASSSFTQLPFSDCSSRAYMFSEAFAMHLQNNNREKMAEVLAEWEIHCGLNEPVFRARSIYQIMMGDFPGLLEKEDFLAQAIAFEIRHEISENQDQPTREEYFAVYREYFGFIPINSNYDRRTLQKARELLPAADPDKLSYAFLLLYSGNTQDFFQLLKNGSYTSTLLSDQYSARLTSLRRKPEFNFGISSGLWIPSGDLEIIGMKPSIGVFAGVTRLNTSLNAVFEMRFGRTESPVSINIRDSLVQTNIHHGSYFGLEGNRIILKTGKMRMGIFLSAGYNLIDIVEEALLDPERHTFGSWAFSGGAVFDFVFANRTRIGLHPGFVILNHHQTAGSSLEGNAFILKLVFGYSENARKFVNLKRLGY